MWDEFLTGPVESHVIPGEHLEVFREPNVRVLADKLKEYLERA
jgi:thioesterase domain-containing protein